MYLWINSVKEKEIKYVEGTGEDVVERGKEKLVRFNLFGTK